MLLRKLTVKNFRNIGHAQIQFGPRLNVLYGPNELGKSGLAEAIRAAFLVRPGSAAAYQFIPWETQLIPEVVVEFETRKIQPDEVQKTEDENEDGETNPVTGVTWRLRKEFSRAGEASLHRLTAGGGAILEAEGRAVEGELQALLNWGIRPPGGRSGGGRGIPGSYLTTALLGRQDRVGEIFEAELASDKHESGREALTQALGALGQDPIVGAVIGRLDTELQPVFSERGQQRRVQDSPIVQLMEKVKAQKQAVEQLEQMKRESRDTRERFDAARKWQQVLVDQELLVTESVTHWQAMQMALQTLKQTCGHASDIAELQSQLADLQQQKQEAEDVRASAERTSKEHEDRYAEAKDNLVTARTKLQELDAGREQSEVAIRQKHEASLSKCEQSLEQANELRQTIAARSELDAERMRVSRRLATAQTEMTRAERLLKVGRLEEQLTQEQSNAKAFDDSAERCRQAESTHQKHVEALTQASKQLTDAESRHEELREELQAARELLVEVNQSSGKQAALRSSLENRIRKTQGEYRLVKQLEDKRLSRNGHRESVEELGDQKSRLDLDIETFEADERAAAAVSVRWRIGLAATALLLAAGLALGVAFSEHQVAGFVIAGVSAVGLVGTFIIQGRYSRRTKESAAERLKLTETRREVSSRLFLAESNLTSADQDYENALTECREFLTDELIPLEDALGRVKTVRAELEKFDAEPPDELVSQRTQRVADTESNVESVRNRIRELKDECGRQQELVDQALASLSSERGSHARLKRLPDDELRNLATQIDAEREKLGLGADFRVAGLETTKAELQNTKNTVRELEDDLNRIEARLEDPNRAMRITGLVETLTPVAQAIDEDVYDRFRHGPDEQSLEKVVAHIETKKREIGQKIRSVSIDKEDEIGETEREFQEAEDLVKSLTEKRQTAAAEVTEAADKLNELNGQCEVKQNDLDRLTASDKSSRNPIDCTGEYNVALTDWQNYEKQLDDGQRACLQTTQLPESSQLLAIGELQTGEDFPTKQIDDQLKQCEGSIESLKKRLEEIQHDAKEAAKSRHTVEGELQKVVGPDIEEDVARAREELTRLQNQGRDLESDYEAWKFLRDCLRDIDARNSAHLGRQLAQPVQQAFRELTEDRYGELILSPEMSLSSISAQGDSRKPEEMSVGTRDQLATLIRLTLAAQLQSVLVLDDQLAHSDTERMAWFRRRLRDSSVNNQHQIIVVTCRLDDYVDELDDTITLVDMAKRIQPVIVGAEVSD